MSRRLLILLVLVFSSISSFGQPPQDTNQRQDTSQLPFLSAVNMASEHIDIPNITYVTANHYQAKLDLYRPAGSSKPTPVVIVIHGGGWVTGTKEEVVTWALPFMQMGFAVINVEYRLANASLAPAAVEDCLCVLHWVGRNAAAQNFDLNKVVVTGASAGGHLALTTAMIPTSAGFESECANDDDASGGAGPWPNQRAKVAAVVNWFGITDVADLIHGENTRAYAVTWIGSQASREEMARKMSPLTYVRGDLPPILTIHGDRDTFVPYSHAVRLHQALTQAGVKNQLLTISGKGHGNFNLEENTRAWQAVRSFLADAGITATKE